MSLMLTWLVVVCWIVSVGLLCLSRLDTDVTVSVYMLLFVDDS